MAIGTDQKTGCTAGRVQNSLVFLRVYDFHHHVNDMAGRAELSGIPLTAHNRQQILKGIAQILAVVIREVADFLEGTYSMYLGPDKGYMLHGKYPGNSWGRLGVRSHFLNAFRIE